MPHSQFSSRRLNVVRGSSLVQAAFGCQVLSLLTTPTAITPSFVAVIKVGAYTETEIKEKKARVEDALHATRAAVEEGIVPGGGVALIRALSAIEKIDGLSDEQAVGVSIIRRACEEPRRQIATNAGASNECVLDKRLHSRLDWLHGGHNYERVVRRWRSNCARFRSGLSERHRCGRHKRLLDHRLRWQRHEGAFGRRCPHRSLHR